jgi:hypothetical protein
MVTILGVIINPENGIRVIPLELTEMIEEPARV